jgi:hypothetical protein
MGEMDEAVDRIKVIVADFPPAELILDGAEPRLPLAAFGPPLDPQSLTSSRSQLSGIVVYRRNLARFTRNRDEFFAELKASLEQELNAFFAPAVQRTREPAEKKVARAKTKTAKNPKKKAAKKRTTEKPRTDNK